MRRLATPKSEPRAYGLAFPWKPGARSYTAAGLFFTALSSFAFLTLRADAQCSRSCPPDQRDAHGCCPAAPVVQSGPLPARPAVPACPDGQAKNDDTAGHCCWQGQAWAGRCVGVPTSCPQGYEADRKSQQCVQTACDEGMVRAPNDKTRCCFAGQAWSKTRSQCVGVPKSCPAGFEANGETCTSTDRDHDGIPNATDRCPDEPEDKDGFEDADGCPDPDNDSDGILDKRDGCPNQPEDKNGYKDEDGCPDEEERLAVLAQAEQQKRAEAEAVAERTRQEEAEAAAQRKAEAARQEQVAHEGRIKEARLKAASGRSAGIGLLATGLSCEVVMGVFLGLGAMENGKIQGGGETYGQDLQTDANNGKIFNYAAIGFGAVGGVLSVIGLPLIIANRTPKDSDVALVPAPGGAALKGSF